MIHQRLVEYIQKNLADGFREDELRVAMRKEGWDDPDIEAALITARAIGANTQLPKKTTVPVPPPQRSVPSGRVVPTPTGGPQGNAPPQSGGIRSPQMSSAGATHAPISVAKKPHTVLWWIITGAIAATVIAGAVGVYYYVSFLP